MSHNTKKSEIRELNKMFFGAAVSEEDGSSAAEPPYLPPYLNTLTHRYPDVPEPHHYTWERTDVHTKHTADWGEAFSRADSALTQAQDVCSAFTLRKAPMTVRDLRAMKIAILHALHSLDDILTTLTLNYPLPNRTSYSLISEDSILEKYAPELLLNTPDRILIRLPAMPPRSKATSSHLYHEFKGLLRENTFAWFPYWHCDFIHVFHPTDLHGIRDVDNYPYKPIIDALTRTLATKDSNTHFSCGMYNHISKTIKTGSYILITKTEEKVRFFQDFEELAQKVYCGEKGQPIPELPE